MDGRADLKEVLERLHDEFPGVEREIVESVIRDSYTAVLEAGGVPVLGKTEELARLRLELRAAYSGAASTLRSCPTGEDEAGEGSARFAGY